MTRTSWTLIAAFGLSLGALSACTPEKLSVSVQELNGDRKVVIHGAADGNQAWIYDTVKNTVVHCRTLDGKYPACEAVRIQ